MKEISFLIVYFLFFSFLVEGQNKDSVSSEMELAIIARVNQGNSYITFPTDIGNIEPLWFEANLSPNFFIRKSKDSRLMGVITPQVIIRMYQEESFPIKTPSYIPQITAYYKMFYGAKKHTINLFAKIAHHSNGQKNDFYLEDGKINLLSGDFATNYFEVGIITTKSVSYLNAHQFFKTSLEAYPTKWSCVELKNNYSKVRWHNMFSVFKLPKSENTESKKKAKISLKGEATLMFGNVKGWEDFSSNRLNLKFTLYYHPRFFENIGFFTQVFHGRDYYNIYFNHQLDIIRFGIMTEKLRF